jgi:nitronate monooxygenase
MPISTPLTARLGIAHPILSAPMDFIAGARLTKAVSAAGSGILGGGYGDEAWLEQEAAACRCSDPFGIGFITGALPSSRRY